jgi:hypothetical protein
MIDLFADQTVVRNILHQPAATRLQIITLRVLAPSRVGLIIPVLHSIMVSFISDVRLHASV